MEFALVLRELWGRKKLLIAGFLIALVAAVLSVYRPDGMSLKPRSLVYSAASTQVLVDQSSSVLGNSSQIFDGPDARATVFANFMTSPAVLALIGEKAGIPGDQLYAAGPVNPNVPRVVQEPTAGARNVQITGETDPYRLTLNADPALPIIDIYSQAPTTKQAIALANGAVSGLQEYLTNVENTDKIRPSNRVEIHPLGTATGGPVDPGIRKSLAGLVFLVVFVLWCVALLVGARFRANWLASAEIHDAEGQPLEGQQREGQPRPASPSFDGHDDFRDDFRDDDFRDDFPATVAPNGHGKDHRHGRRAVAQRTRASSRDGEDTAVVLPPHRSG